jgi:hypothetical protein
MMQRLKVMGLALVAVFAMSAVVVASASAEPEFEPKKGAMAFPVKFSSSSTTNKTKLETVKGNLVSCEGLTSSGEVASARKATNVVVKFKKCSTKVGIFTANCEGGTGHGAQEIVTEKLTAKPVYIEGKTSKTVKEEKGLDVEPTTSNGKFAEFVCGGVTTIVVQGLSGKDSVIGRIAAAEVGVFSKTTKITFKETKGVQEPTKYEEPAGTLHEDFLESEGKGGGGAFAQEQSAESAVETIEYAGGEEVELKLT